MITKFWTLGTKRMCQMQTKEIAKLWLVSDVLLPAILASSPIEIPFFQSWIWISCQSCKICVKKE